MCIYIHFKISNEIMQGVLYTMYTEPQVKQNITQQREQPNAGVFYSQVQLIGFAMNLGRGSPSC